MPGVIKGTHNLKKGGCIFRESLVFNLKKEFSVSFIRLFGE
jgi:hypothetical protein